MNCAEDPFNMGVFYNSRSHSKWVYFQIPNTHIRAFLYWSRPGPYVNEKKTLKKEDGTFIHFILSINILPLGQIYPYPTARGNCCKGSQMCLAYIPPTFFCRVGIDNAIPFCVGKISNISFINNSFFFKRPWHIN